MSALQSAGHGRAVTIVGLAALGLVAAPALVHAEPAAVNEPAVNGPVVLSWRAVDRRCPDEAALRMRVDALLDGAAVGLVADAEVHAPEPGAARWRLDLQIRWARGSDDRTLYASSCGALADATVVLVAALAAPMALADNLGSVPLPPPGPTVVTPAPAPVIAPVIAPAIAPASPEDAGPDLVAPTAPVRAPWPAVARRRGAFARVAAVVGHGVLPRFDVGVQLAAGALLPRLRLEGALTVLPPQAAELADGSGLGAVAGFAALALRACPRFLGAPVELSLCAAVEGGLSWGRSVGVSPERRAVGPQLGFALGPALDWWFSPQVGLHVGVEVVGAPVTTTFALGEQPIAGGRHFGVRGIFGLSFALAQQKPGRPEK